MSEMWRCQRTQMSNVHLIRSEDLSESSTQILSLGCRCWQRRGKNSLQHTVWSRLISNHQPRCQSLSNCNRWESAAAMATASTTSTSARKSILIIKLPENSSKTSTTTTRNVRFGPEILLDDEQVHFSLSCLSPTRFFFKGSHSWLAYQIEIQVQSKDNWISYPIRTEMIPWISSRFLSFHPAFNEILASSTNKDFSSSSSSSSRALESELVHECVQCLVSYPDHPHRRRWQFSINRLRDSKYLPWVACSCVRELNWRLANKRWFVFIISPFARPLRRVLNRARKSILTNCLGQDQLNCTSN